MSKILTLLLILSGGALVAHAQVSPTPVINNEVRDPTSIRMRSVEFERIERESQQGGNRSPLWGSEHKFAVIREDFENIQKIQSEIVEAYTAGETVELKKLSRLAGEMAKKAVRLESNLFGQATKQKRQPQTDFVTKSMRDLIITLDNEIGEFVQDPIFTDLRLFDAKASEKSQAALGRIVKLAEALSSAASQPQ